MAFSNNFIWGAASADYQIEGAYDEDGKGLGIWDTTIREPGRVKYNETGDVACDHYHRYKEDIANMKKIGIRYYRFSISWPRVMPHGIGEINQKGLEFYSDLVNELLLNDIVPMVTLFHWNYPDTLYKKGGWLHEDSPEWFAEYAKIIVDRLSDRVKYWMTINEPQLFIGAGYMAGFHAPFERNDNKKILKMCYHVMLAHGKAVDIIRRYSKLKATVGFAPTGPCVTPENNSVEAIEAARKASFDIDDKSYAFSNSFWSDPIILGDYPEKAYELFGEDLPRLKEEDKKIICQPLDFYGANIYQSMVQPTPEDESPSNCSQGCPKTMMNWPVTPECLYWGPKFLYERYHLPILITENGMAGMDWVHADGKVHDSYRIDFITRYLREFKRAALDGVDIMGYIYWSIMDNFEWSEGYDKRFGLVYVDFKTQKRTIKDSGYWYKTLIENNDVV